MEVSANPIAADKSDETVVLERKAAALKRASLALGEILSVFMVSQRHARFSIADLQWLVMPALVRRQYLVVHAPAKKGEVPIPGAVLLWGEVSADVDQRLSKDLQTTIKLDLQERASGDILWITDVAGDPRLVNAGLERLMGTRFAGRSVKLVTKDKDGQPMLVEHRR